MKQGRPRERVFTGIINRYTCFFIQHFLAIDMSRRLALFDLDNTLLAGDSDHAWGEFLIAEKLVNAESHRASNDAFYQQYLDGQLDIHAYVEFTIEPITTLAAEQREALHKKFMDEVIKPLVLEKGKALVDAHASEGDTCIIITATNDFITRPIAQLFGIDILLATELEETNGLLSGRITGIPCYQGGKVEKLQQWINANCQEADLADACFYSDSINDLPLLERVANPVAVDPDEELAVIAAQRNWKTISLRP